MKSFLMLLFAGLFASSTYADESSKHHCKQPVLPSAQASALVIKYFDKHMEEYKKCLNTFITEQQAISKSATDQATINVAHDQAEAAIKEYNSFLEEVNARDIRAGKDPDGEN